MSHEEEVRSCWLMQLFTGALLCCGPPPWLLAWWWWHWFGAWHNDRGCDVLSTAVVMRAVHQHVEGGGGWRGDEECSVRVVPLLTFALPVMDQGSWWYACRQLV